MRFFIFFAYANVWKRLCQLPPPSPSLRSSLRPRRDRTEAQQHNLVDSSSSVTEARVSLHLSDESPYLFMTIYGIFFSWVHFLSVSCLLVCIPVLIPSRSVCFGSSLVAHPLYFVFFCPPPCTSDPLPVHLPFVSLSIFFSPSPSSHFIHAS